MAEQANWYVAHTYSGYENKVATDLMTMVENHRIGAVRVTAPAGQDAPQQAAG